MNKILLILDKIDANNKHMIEDLTSIIKTKGAEIFYSFFIEIPMQYPIDTEDEYFKNDFDLAEQILKSFEKEMNLKKIAKSRMFGGIFKVRDLNFGIIEKAFEDSPDLVIIPERLIKSNLNSNKFNNNLVITKVMDEINTSIMFWQDKG